MIKTLTIIAVLGLLAVIVCTAFGSWWAYGAAVGGFIGGYFGGVAILMHEGVLEVPRREYHGEP